MKANELRIGNYFLVNWSKEIRKADCLDIRDISEQRITVGVSAIPLTTEVLKKCGFEYVTDWTVPDKRKHDCVTFLDLGYMYLASGMMGGGVTLFQNDRRSTGTNIEYLHQLQNLYFAISGQELEVNL